jgi:hypothetical protein
VEGRCIGLDVHRDFCEQCIWEDGAVRRAPRISARPEELARFAAQLDQSDRVALEATGNALAIARIIEPHVAEVVIVNTRKLAAISDSKQKTDRHDAKTLAQMLAAGMLSGSWMPDELTRSFAASRRPSRPPGHPSHAVQERGSRGTASQPHTPTADDRRVRRRWPRVARPTGATRG